MTIAIRHKKPRPAWLALIAVLAAGVTIVATLATVVIDSVVQARRGAGQPAVALTTGAEASRDVRVTVPVASRESPDALAARAEEGARAAAQATAAQLASSASLPSVGVGGSAAGGRTNGPAPADARPAAPTREDGRPEKPALAGDTVSEPAASAPVASSETVASSDPAAASEPAAVPKHRYLPSRASAHGGVRRSGLAVGGGDGSLRADITRYNAERGGGAERRRAQRLRAASVPSGHSLWDEVPRPLSELYRN